MTTRYLGAAAVQLREGHEIWGGDVARLSPLKHRNLNVRGRYSLTASGSHEGLRPLRDPDAVGLDDDDDGVADGRVRPLPDRAPPTLSGVGAESGSSHPARGGAAISCGR